jgi:hypothetical protein
MGSGDRMMLADLDDAMACREAGLFAARAR